MNRHTHSRSVRRSLTSAVDLVAQALIYQIEQLEKRVLLAVDSTAVELYNTSPAVFVQNQGQWADTSVEFVHQGNGASIALTDAGPVFQLSRATETVKSSSITPRNLTQDPPKMIGTEFSVHFDGSNRVSPVGMDRSESSFSYFIGEKSRWRSNVGGFEKIEYPSLYSGIDMQTWGKVTHLKYEFHVAAGANYEQIEISYDGIQGLSLDRKGRLHVNTTLDELIDDKPFVYQDIDGKRIEIASKFALIDKDTYRFQIIGSIDSRRELVIDPSLAWGSYLGASGDDRSRSIAVDGSGNAWITGCTYSSDFRVDGFDSSFNGGDSDAFVAKINANGTLAWSSYLGGSTTDDAYGICVDGSGNAWVIGVTNSANFPSGGFDSIYNGDWDAFVAKINADGTLAWGSYLGGSDGDIGRSIAADGSGNVWVTGYTNSTDFPGGGFDSSSNGYYDAFVAKVNANGTLAWGSYLGGSSYDDGLGIDVDGSGNAWVTGATNSDELPGGGFDANTNGGAEAFVAKVNANGTLAWCSYLGGLGYDDGEGIAVDGSGNAWVTGYTDSTDFPGGGFDSTYNGGIYDAFVAKINANGTLAWGSYLGGSGIDYSYGIAVDGSGNAWITGDTDSKNFPGGGFDASFNGSSDAFVSMINGNGTLAWASYLGGDGSDGGNSIAVDGSGSGWVTGYTSSTDFPSGGFDSYYNGDWDAFVAKVTRDFSPPSQKPYFEMPIEISPLATATIQSENFDKGGEGVATHDLTPNANTGGQYRLNEGVDIKFLTVAPTNYRLSDAWAGEWLEYSINVTNAGFYDFDFRVANLGTGGVFHVEIDPQSSGPGTGITGNLSVPNTGSLNTMTSLIKKGIPLPAGMHVLRLAMDQNSSTSKAAGGFDSLRISWGSSLTVGSISGVVYVDRDGDASRDADEMGLSGITLYNDADNDKIMDSNEPRAMTDVSGKYNLSDLTPGSYKIRQILPTGWSQTTPANGFGWTVTLAANQTVTGRDFGAKQAAPAGASISGSVFSDLNGNGKRDSGELGLANRTIWIDLDNDQKIDSNERSTLTDAQGNYVVSGLAAGTYKVRQLLPTGWKQTTPSNGYGISVSLTSNQKITGKLFGEKRIA